MRLKFYLMGLGIGVIVSAIIMGIAMRGRTREMTDEEIMARARQLGMVEAGTLAEMTAGANNQNADQNRETVTQTQPQETPAAQAGTSGTEGAGSADADAQKSGSGTAGEDNSSVAQTGGGAGTADSAERTAADESLVVEGEPVDEETGPDAASAQDSAGAGSGQSNAGTADTGVSAGGTQSGNANALGRSGDTNTAQGGASVSRTSASVGASSEQAQATGSIVVTIPDGLYSEDISALLETAGVVDNAAAFNDYLVNSGQDRYITVGACLIPRGSSYEDVARIITGR